MGKKLKNFEKGLRIRRQPELWRSEIKFFQAILEFGSIEMNRLKGIIDQKGIINGSIHQSINNDSIR